MGFHGHLLEFLRRPICKISRKQLDFFYTDLNMISPTFIRWYTWPRTTLPHTVSPLSAISSSIRFSAWLIICTFPCLHPRLLSHLDGLDSWDTAMAQKSHFKMQTQGITKFRKTFPQLPGCVVENPTFIQTAHG